MIFISLVFQKWPLSNSDNRKPQKAMTLTNSAIMKQCNDMINNNKCDSSPSGMI